MRKMTSVALVALGIGLFGSVGSAVADISAGAYLAARQAGAEHDYAAAADYYTRAIVSDPDNVSLMDAAMAAYVGLGDFDRAAPIATRVIQSTQSSQIGNLVLLSRDAQRENWDAVIANLDAGQSVGPLFDGLLRAWAMVGQGRMTDALAAFDTLSTTQGVKVFGLYHKALALASVGDLEGAAKIFSGESGERVTVTRTGVITYAEILGQLERGADGVDLIRQSFGEDLDPELQQLSDALEAGAPVTFTGVTTPKEGIAEAAYTIARALNGEASDGYSLVYARVAEYLDPAHIEAILMTAGLLDSLGQYELATEAYAKVPPGDPSFYSAELGRAEALRRSGRTDEGIAALRALAEAYPDLSVIHTTLGDALRREERYDDATAAYDKAIALFQSDQESQWVVYFSRGITHEREDRWPQAEADFRKALELQPDQPQVLNYLGYSMVEMQTNLDEALSMIERAVQGDPESGYITDSLGWVLYRLGRYDEAVGHMERAVELLPVDPIVNDHLGDVYWAVGRTLEAEFQWHRALSFDPEEEDATRIRRKLEVGLDAVLQEEGAPPLRVANDG